ncbi:E3 ubiquitin-protein ligase WAV3-like [Papaver somniferum]|uniref:E3 ubiquitin-protein ligase WAV3-like n=1 Tax=Papaver somniferum TaxID=3469 RepID=UPI000E70190A|nr:E3 ubiquitin-protein ligase WAV3-like [Papaver somniferum]
MVRICTLCDGALKVGDGNAIFSAECSHSFHFNCIASYVKYGNRICPTCAAKWKDIPFTSPPNPTSGQATFQLNWPSQLNSTPAPPWPCIPLLRKSTSKFPSSEPSSVFNDDDPLINQYRVSSNDISIIRFIDINTHTEFPAVQRSFSQENFHILINLKAHVTDINQVHSRMSQTGLLSVVVQDLRVHVHSLDPCLFLSQLKAGCYSTYLTDDYQTGSVDIGDLYADEERDFLVLVNIPVVAGGNSDDQMEFVSVWCDYKDPFTKASITTEAIEVELQRPEIVNEEDMVVSIEVDRQKNRFRVAHAMSNSRAAAERGDMLTAWSIIDDCRMRISETASMHAGDKFSVDLDLELQEARSRMGNRKSYESTGRDIYFQD